MTVPLDPQAEDFLRQQRLAGNKVWELMTPFEARDAARTFKPFSGKPEAVASLDHLFIPGPTADLPLWIYRPKQDLEALQPALIYFHGSGWVVSNIETADPFSRSLANRSGCVIIAVNYQKAPEHKFPLPFDDCYAATEWVFNNSTDLRIDPARIGVLGDSAGGNLAAAVALKARDQNGPAIKLQVLIYPAVAYAWDTPSYLANAEGYGLQRAGMIYFWNHYIHQPSDASNPYFSPLSAKDHSGLPPAFIVAAEYDPLCDDAENYARKLEMAGVKVKFNLYRGMIHGFLWMAGVFDQSRALIDEIAQQVKIGLAD